MSKIDFHHGEALLRVAGTYQTLSEVIFENIQNALDALARNIHVRVNFKKRTCSVSDDGVGASQSKFEEALLSVCHSIKDPGKLGKFGMGAISPLGKCERFTFTSASKVDSRSYLCWTFDTEEIRRQSRIKGVPMERLADIHFQRLGKDKGGVPWRTQVKMFNFTKDRVLSRLTIASLREGILERYSEAMKRRNTMVIIELVQADGREESERFVADVYEGKKLPVEYFKHSAAGQTRVSLYLARKAAAGYNGKILIGELGKDFRISFQQFCRHAGGYLDSEIVKGLSSGIFEGEIVGEKIAFHPSRKCFQDNEALLEFCLAMEEWYRKIGAEHVSRVKEEAQDDRYQRLGRRSIQVIEELLRLPEFEYLRKIVKSFSVGTIGRGHVQPPNRVVGPPQEYRSVSSEAISGKRAAGQPPVNSPQKEHSGHIPFTVAGPRGRQRATVKSNSMGLQFVYEEMRREGKLWELDTQEGVLRFNIRHPLWHECEVDERALMRFQESIAIDALTLEAAPQEWQDQLRRMIDEKLPAIVFWLLRGDEIAGRKPGSALKQYQERKKRACA